MKTRLSPLVQSRLRFLAHVRSPLGRAQCGSTMTSARVSGDASFSDARAGLDDDPNRCPRLPQPRYVEAVHGQPAP